MHLVVGAEFDVSGTARISRDHQGAPGIAHGGVLAAVMDEALGSLNWLLRRPAVTANLDVDFLHPVPVETTLWVSGRIVDVDGRKVRTEGEARLHDSSGDLCLRASALFIAVDAQHFRRHGTADSSALEP